ncbi:Uncharacterised protein [BD1-7 clade bacterium]|uniref:Uncharacterized protein n=1 Tax=BD1-7 clade bacterium TaxID=2029982 RepID=A0A5S9N0N8_9GAMM|nr:Uncharacterised protein [BD1-7 clade bacterium]
MFLLSDVKLQAIYWQANVFYRMLLGAGDPIRIFDTVGVVIGSIAYNTHLYSETVDAYV